MSISKEEKREIRAGTVHIGAYISCGLVIITALLAGGGMIEKVANNEKEIAKIRESNDAKNDKILYLESQIQAINFRERLKEG